MSFEKNITVSTSYGTTSDEQSYRSDTFDKVGRGSAALASGTLTLTENAAGRYVYVKYEARGRDASYNVKYTFKKVLAHDGTSWKMYTLDANANSADLFSTSGHAATTPKTSVLSASNTSSGLAPDVTSVGSTSPHLDDHNARVAVWNHLLLKTNSKEKNPGLKYDKASDVDVVSLSVI